MKSFINFSSTLLFSNSLKWFLSLTILFCLVTFIGCKKSKPPVQTPEELALENLIGTWNLGSVTRSSKLVTDEFPGFSLIIDGGSKTLSASNDQGIFPADNQWDFDGEVTIATGPFNIIAGGIPMVITSLTATNITLTFTYNAPGGRAGGRMANLSGLYVFSLEKK